MYVYILYTTQRCACIRGTFHENKRHKYFVGNSTVDDTLTLSSRSISPLLRLALFHNDISASRIKVHQRVRGYTDVV